MAKKKPPDIANVINPNIAYLMTLNNIREKRLAERKNSIGGSEIGAILGLNRYASPYSIWANKMGLTSDEEDNEAKALPSVMTPERFTRITLSALSTTPKLQECTPQSFLGAMMTAAQLGLEPNTPLGQAYLIPYGKKCQFQLGYKGLIDLAYRSGEVSIIQAQTVYESDTFAYELGLDPKLKYVPATSDRGEPVFFYAVFKTKDGGYGFEVAGVDDIRSHVRRFSRSNDSGPWLITMKADDWFEIYREWEAGRFDG